LVSSVTRMGVMALPLPGSAISLSACAGQSGDNYR
jgi:hypothetical protein